MPSGGASIGADVLETNVKSSRPSCTREEILGAHPMSDDVFWGGTSPGDVSIDIANSKKRWQEVISLNNTRMNIKDPFHLNY